MQPAKSLGDYTSPWCGPHHATQTYGNTQGLMVALSASLHATHKPVPVLLK